MTDIILVATETSSMLADGQSTTNMVVLIIMQISICVYMFSNQSNQFITSTQSKSN